MKKSPLRALAAFFILAVGAGILIFAVSTSSAGQRDFISYWAAGKQLLHNRNPYDSAAVLALERSAGLDGTRPLLMRNPPVALFLAIPLGLVGSRTGMILWMLILMVSLMASVRMIWILFSRRTDRLHLLSYCFAPVLACLMAGQLGIFILFGITLFLTCFYRLQLVCSPGLFIAKHTKFSPDLSWRSRPAPCLRGPWTLMHGRNTHT
jgi:hypothetical protein